MKKPPAPSATKLVRQAEREAEAAVTEAIYIILCDDHSDECIVPHEYPAAWDRRTTFLVNYRGNDYRITVTKEVK